MADDTKAAEELQLVVFSLGREEFAVEVTQVREIMRMEEITRMPKSPHFVEGIINLRGQIIAVVELAKRLNLESGEKSSDTRIIVVEAEDIKVGMIVDSVSEVLRVSADDGGAEPDTRHRHIRRIPAGGSEAGQPVDNPARPDQGALAAGDGGTRILDHKDFRIAKWERKGGKDGADRADRR